MNRRKGQLRQHEQVSSNFQNQLHCSKRSELTLAVHRCAAARKRLDKVRQPNNVGAADSAAAAAASAAHVPSQPIRNNGQRDQPLKGALKRQRGHLLLPRRRTAQLYIGRRAPIVQARQAQQIYSNPRRRLIRFNRAPLCVCVWNVRPCLIDMQLQVGGAQSVQRQLAWLRQESILLRLDSSSQI